MKIIKREIDNSYVIEKNGHPYHVPNSWPEWAQINEYAVRHPEDVTVERAPLPKTFAELRADKKTEISAARYKAERAGMIFKGHRIATDDIGQSRITEAAFSAIEDGTYSIPEWLCADGIFIELSNSEILEMKRALRDYTQDKFRINKLLFEAIDAAMTPVDLAAIKWSDEI